MRSRAGGNRDARPPAPTATILPPRTTIVALSIGARSVPSITRAPVKAFDARPADCAGVGSARRAEATAARARQRRDMGCDFMCKHLTRRATMQRDSGSGLPIVPGRARRRWRRSSTSTRRSRCCRCWRAPSARRPSRSGLTITAPTIAVAIFAPVHRPACRSPGPPPGDRRCRRSLTVATALAATSQTLHQLIFWRFVQGFATPGVFASTVAYIHEVWPPTHAGRATAAYMTGTILGGFTGRAVAGLIAADASWQASFVALGDRSPASSRRC